MQWRSGFGLAAALLGLAACAQPQTMTAPPAAPMTPPQRYATSLPASAPLAPRPVEAGAPTGTFVGAKVLQLRGDLDTMQRGLVAHSQQLRETQVATAQHAERYHALVAGINARLQVGTTKGNPILTSQLGEAQGQLGRHVCQRVPGVCVG